MRKELAPAIKTRATTRRGRHQPYKYTIKDMQKLAHKKGGKCLSNKYLGIRSKLTWQCSHGHTWTTAPHSIKNGKTWCPICGHKKGGNKPLTLELFRRIAHKKKGKCLSNEYINQNTPLLFECEFGHRWETKPANIRQGHWCPTCFGSNPLPIEEMQSIAKTRGGKCLSRKYVNLNHKLQWQCRHGHKWKATPRSVKHQKNWCPICKPIKLAKLYRSDLSAMRKLANRNSGKCLSTKYRNARSHLLWECSKGHTWFATPTHIQSGEWCPKCKYKSEQKCRETFENIFNQPFECQYPKWLINPKTKSRLHLDGYNQNLGIAFEYNGIQHYMPVDHFGGERGFLKRKENDIHKQEICLNHGVKLIIIPYHVENSNLKNFILSECKRLSIPTPTY